jgi:AmmeMemoRadiSam system protein A
MALAKKMKMVPTLLDARTSYETAPQSGPATRVVGYASIVYVEDKEGSTFLDKKEKNNLETKSLSDGTKKYLLTLARQALELATNDKTMSEPDVAVVPQEARDKAGCFVTLTMKGQLRGCIGYIQGIKPLYLAVMDNARNAALNDPRFSPVTSGDAAQIVVEISVLTEPEPIVYKDPQDLLQQIVPGQDGIILQKENHQSTFLPQVWEQLTNKVSFLEHLSIKGGMSADAWKSAYVKRYRAIHFSEK